MLKCSAKKLYLILKKALLYVIIAQRNRFVKKNKKISKLKNAILKTGRALCLLVPSKQNNI